MLAYSTVGTNDLERARGFYDALFAEIGAKRIFNMETFTSYGVAQDQPMFAIAKPYDGNEATVGNGVMIAIAAKDADQVTALHAKALELGGTCEGEPGPRMDGAFSCGYVRDLDGNKLNFFSMSA